MALVLVARENYQKPFFIWEIAYLGCSGMAPSIVSRMYQRKHRAKPKIQAMNIPKYQP